jgi:hypothetical protein
MATRFRDLFFTPLEPEAARKLTLVLDDLLAPGDGDAGAEPVGPLPAALGSEGAHLRVSSVEELRDEDEGYLFDGDVLLEAVAGAPTEDELVARGFTLDEQGRARLGTVRSTIRLVHDARAADAPIFVSLQRLLLDRIGPSLVERHGATTWLTSEEAARELVGKRGASRLEALRTERKPKRKTREARPGELEAVALRARLEESIDDPFTSAALRSGLAAAAPSVQSYAALLLDEGPASDERAAKLLGAPVKTSDVKAAREALAALCGPRQP